MPDNKAYKIITYAGIQYIVPVWASYLTVDSDCTVKIWAYRPVMFPIMDDEAGFWAPSEGISWDWEVELETEGVLFQGYGDMFEAGWEDSLVELPAPYCGGVGNG